MSTSIHILQGPGNILLYNPNDPPASLHLGPSSFPSTPIADPPWLSLPPSTEPDLSTLHPDSPEKFRAWLEMNKQKGEAMGVYIAKLDVEATGLYEVLWSIATGNGVGEVQSMPVPRWLRWEMVLKVLRQRGREDLALTEGKRGRRSEKRRRRRAWQMRMSGLGCAEGSNEYGDAEMLDGEEEEEEEEDGEEDEEGEYEDPADTEWEGGEEDYEDPADTEWEGDEEDDEDDD